MPTANQVAFPTIPTLQPKPAKELTSPTPPEQNLHFRKIEKGNMS